jgi:hypothetical protein
MIAFGHDGKVVTMTAEQWLPRPLEAVFPFFADAGNLDVLTPSWLRFEILTPCPIKMREGARIDYRLRWHGLPMRWQSAITKWEPPHCFVDEQRHGPYRLWHHEHRFSESDGRTLVRDHVRYAVPGGLLIDRLFVRRDVHRIFAFRQAKLAGLFR